MLSKEVSAYEMQPEVDRREVKRYSDIIVSLVGWCVDVASIENWRSAVCFV